MNVFKTIVEAELEERAILLDDGAVNFIALNFERIARDYLDSEIAGPALKDCLLAVDGPPRYFHIEVLASREHGAGVFLLEIKEIEQDEFLDKKLELDERQRKRDELDVKTWPVYRSN
jgi:hypothetical protein